MFDGRLRVHRRVAAGGHRQRARATVLAGAARSETTRDRTFSARDGRRAARSTVIGVVGNVRSTSLADGFGTARLFAVIRRHGDVRHDGPDVDRGETPRRGECGSDGDDPSVDPRLVLTHGITGRRDRVRLDGSAHTATVSGVRGSALILASMGLRCDFAHRGAGRREFAIRLPRRRARASPHGAQPGAWLVAVGSGIGPAVAIACARLSLSTDCRPLTPTLVGTAVPVIAAAASVAGRHAVGEDGGARFTRSSRGDLDVLHIDV